MSSTRAFWFIPYRYVVPADLERWFEERAAGGLVAERIGQLSSFRMGLAQRNPGTYRYVVDLQAAPRGDYRTTYEDLGWDHVGQMASMHVWRRAYTGPRPESFTDQPSETRRDLRFAAAVGGAATMLLVTALVLAIVAAETGGDSQLWVSAGVIGLIGLAIAAASIVILRARHR